MIKEKPVRKVVCKQNLYWYLLFYFAHYIKYAFAEFHHILIHTLEDRCKRLVTVVAFRGSGKSTIVSLIYLLWAVMGREERKFILIVGKTQEQARQLLRNIRTELETNTLLRSDLGPFREEEDEWRNMSLVLSNYGARITAVSVGQGIRGLRHGRHRPDLILCDDIEDLESVKTREGREKTHEWYTSELVPAGDKDTRTVVVGNYLHDDSLTQRLRLQSEKHPRTISYIHCPLVDENGVCLWSGKYPTAADVEEEHQRVGDEKAWHREYLLHILSTDEQIIRQEWIQYYDTLPPDSHKNFQMSATGVDLAISKNDSADYTAMVSAKVFGDDEDLRIYILPNAVNERLTSLETEDCAKGLARNLGKSDYDHNLFIEDVAYQKALIERLQDAGFNAKGIKVHMQDKSARLRINSHLVQSGKVMFPRKGAERLIEQLVHFGMEKHDDLADAFAILLTGVQREKLSEVKIFLIRPTRLRDQMREWGY